MMRMGHFLRLESPTLEAMLTRYECMASAEQATLVVPSAMDWSIFL